MNDMPIIRYPQLRLNTNPFLDAKYFENKKKIETVRDVKPYVPIKPRK